MPLLWFASLFLSASALEVGDPAPPIPMEGATSEKRVAVVNFWATWCGPCRAELPLLEGLHQRLEPSKAALVAVNLDNQSKPAEGLLKRMALNLPVVYDPDGVITQKYEPPAMPTTYIVDTHGTVVHIHEGGLDETELAALEARIGGLTQ
jgi:thiol-disulfide isomerase/thioredoxin